MNAKKHLGGIRKARVTILSGEVWSELHRLQIADEILDEVLGALKVIPPRDRVKFLHETFE